MSAVDVDRSCFDGALASIDELEAVIEQLKEEMVSAHHRLYLIGEGLNEEGGDKWEASCAASDIKNKLKELGLDD